MHIHIFALLLTSRCEINIQVNWLWTEPNAQKQSLFTGRRPTAADRDKVFSEEKQKNLYENSNMNNEELSNMKLLSYFESKPKVFIRYR